MTTIQTSVTNHLPRRPLEPDYGTRRRRRFRRREPNHFLHHLVAGGVGPMTIAMLLQNTLTAAKLQVQRA